MGMDIPFEKPNAKVHNRWQIRFLGTYIFAGTRQYHLTDSLYLCG